MLRNQDVYSTTGTDVNPKLLTTHSQYQTSIAMSNVFVVFFESTQNMCDPARLALDGCGSDKRIHEICIFRFAAHTPNSEVGGYDRVLHL